MKFSPRKYSPSLLFLFLFSFSGFSFGQSKHFYIQRDFQNCGTGVKDSSGNWVIQPTFENIAALSDKYFRVEAVSKVGVYDNKGNLIIPVIYESIYQEHTDDGYEFMVKNSDKKWGVMDSTGKMIVPVKYRDASIYEDGTIIVRYKWRKNFRTDIHRDSIRIRQKMHSEPRYIADHRFSFTKDFDFIWRQKYGMMDNKGNVLFKPKYSSVSFSEEEYSFTRLEQKHHVLYCDTTGRIIYRFTADRSMTYFYIDEFDYGLPQGPDVNNSGYIVGMNKKHWGIISATGDTIVPFIYKYAFGGSGYGSDGNILEFQTDSATGIFDCDKRKWILQPVYSYLDQVNSYTVTSDSSNGSPLIVFVARKNNLFGVLTSSGQEIVPFRYTYYNKESDDIIFTNENEGMVLTFPSGSEHPQDAKDSTLVMVYSKNDDARVVSRAPAGNYFSKQVASDGAVLFLDTTLIHNRNQKLCYIPYNSFYKSNSFTWDSLLHATAMIVRPMNIVSRNSDGSALAGFRRADLINRNFDNDSEYYYLRDGKFSFTSLYNCELLTHETGMNYFRVYHYYRPGAGIIRSDGKKIIPIGKIRSAQVIYRKDSEEPLFQITSFKHEKQGIIDSDGKLLVDTTWNYIITRYYVDHLLEVELRPNRKESAFHKRTNNVQLLDIRTGDVVIPYGQHPNFITYIGSEDALCIMPDGERVFNATQKKFVTGGFNRIHELDDDGNYFAVKTCTGNIGLIDKNGKFLTDTMWKAMGMADYHAYARKGGDKAANLHYFVFYNEKSHFTFDATVGMIIPDSLAYNEVLRRASGNFTTDLYSNKFITDQHLPAIDYFSGMTYDSLPAWTHAVLYDSILFPKRFHQDTTLNYSYYKCEFCEKNFKKVYFFYNWMPDYEYSSHAHFVRYCTDSVISVARSNYSYPPFFHDHLPECDFMFNTMLFSDGPHPLLLDSLFTGTEWKNFIIQTVMDYLQNNLDVKGECTNPYMFPKILQSSFLICEKGIELYPPGFTHNQEALMIFIPWEKIAPYMRADVKRKLGVK
ncbi:MAG: WG repeat-containing protein [Bacteroidetes bacterium]|nr:WG repeat-containing protein [Bacteroidota bacterium]